MLSLSKIESVGNAVNPPRRVTLVRLKPYTYVCDAYADGYRLIITTSRSSSGALWLVRDASDHAVAVVEADSGRQAWHAWLRAAVDVEGDPLSVYWPLRLTRWRLEHHRIQLRIGVDRSN